jgi:hypothetical protein
MTTQTELFIQDIFLKEKKNSVSNDCAIHYSSKKGKYLTKVNISNSYNFTLVKEGALNV